MIVALHPLPDTDRRTGTLRRNLRASTIDGAAFSVMVGVGETYLPAFVLALGLSDVTAGLIATVPMLAGAVLQVISPRAVRRLGSHRRWVVLCALTQALGFLPLVLAALAGRIPTSLIFLLAAIYWGSGMATGPAWNTWIGTVIPASIRARFFARRTRVTQGCVLGGFLLGGAALQIGSTLQRPLWAFAVLFLIAAMCRFVSARFLSVQSEPTPLPPNHRILPIPELVRRFRDGADGRLLVYLLAVQVAAQIAAPYFTPYMLRQLNLPYSKYVLLIGAAFVAKIIASPSLGRIAHRCGALRLLTIGGVAIVPLSMMWTFSDSFAYLLGVQLLAGTAWAAYELASFLLLFEAIPSEERTSILTAYNVIYAISTVAGSLVGGAALRFFSDSRAGYMILFALSCGARVLTILLLQRVTARDFEPVPVATRIDAVRPSAGSISKPIIVSLPEQKGAFAIRPAAPVR
jgi:MFS family permease